MNTIKLRLVLEVEYHLNGEDIETAVAHLDSVVGNAMNRGLLTGETDMEVEDTKTTIEVVTK